MKLPASLVSCGLCTVFLILSVSCNHPSEPSTESQKGIASHKLDTDAKAPSSPDSREANTTRKVAVRIGDRSQTFTLHDLRALPKVTIADYEAIGVTKGPLGSSTWAGASLKDVLLSVDPALSDSRNAHRLIVLTSSDKYVAVIKWAEMFGSLKGGEALYNIKGCNECHGVNGEGTSPEGKRPAPALVGKDWNFGTVKAVIRAGKDAHARITEYTESRLSDADLRAIMDWAKSPMSPVPAGAFTADPDKMVTLLAYERNGRPMTGKDGLIQLIVGIDEFAGRYSHWVETIEVK